VHLVAAADYTAECAHAANCQHSYLCLPLHSRGETSGLLHFQMIEPGEMPQPVLLFANMFAEQGSVISGQYRIARGPAEPVRPRSLDLSL
jgi:hypothetical protein